LSPGDLNSWNAWLLSLTPDAAHDDWLTESTLHLSSPTFFHLLHTWVPAFFFSFFFMFQTFFLLLFFFLKKFGQRNPIENLPKIKKVTYGFSDQSHCVRCLSSRFTRSVVITIVAIFIMALFGKRRIVENGSWKW
jgi:hypothetical protein